MSNLESRYRSAMRWYPRTWRLRNEEAVVGVLLERAEDEDRAVPARGELRDLRTNALFARLEVLGQSVPANVKRSAATLTLGLGVAISAAGLIFSGLAYRGDSNGHLTEFFSLATFDFNAFSSAIYVAWIGAFVTALAGLRRTTVIALVVSVALSVAWPVVSDTLVRGHTHPGALTSGYLDMLATISALGMFAHPQPPRRAVALSGVLFGLALVAAYELNKFGYWGNGAINVDEFWSPFSVWLIWVGVPLAVVLAIVFWKTRRSPWSAAILLAAVPTLPLGVLAFLTSRSIIFSGIGSAAVAIVFVGIILGILRLFGIRIRITRV